MKKLILAVILLFAVAGCQSQTSTAVTADHPTQNPVPTLPAATQTAVEPSFEIDYQNPPADMCNSESYAFGDFYCENGESHQVAKGHGNIAGWFNDESYKNYIAEIEMRSGSTTGAYGMEFRGRNNPPAFYIFEIRPDGQYQLILWDQSKDIKVLIPWTKSSAINQGDAKNVLKAIVQDSQFTLFANGQQLASYSDETLKSGGAGPVALEEGHAAVSTIKIWQLP